MVRMTKILLCTIVVVVSLAAHRAMAKNDDHTPDGRVVHIVNEQHSGVRMCLDFNPPPLNKALEQDDLVLPAELLPCTHQRQSQFWIVSKEGPIRSLEGNLCLVFDPLFVNKNNFANVYNCDKSSGAAKTWKLWADGIITHLESHLVLTASAAMPHPFVKLEHNNYSPSQIWARVNLKN